VLMPVLVDGQAETPTGLRLIRTEPLSGKISLDGSTIYRKACICFVVGTVAGGSCIRHIQAQIAL
jgi:hypothetical protein